MARRRKLSRSLLTLLAVLAVGGALIAAFWPQPTLVDMGQVVRGGLQVTIDEEGRTQVREAYVVSTPVAGRLLRVQVHPGDQVTGGETVVAQMRPTNPAALDVRTREQAHAVVQAAEAALRVAQADLNAAIAADDLAESDLQRTQSLFDSEIVSQAALDRARGAARAARASLDTARAAISIREAELNNARAQLIGFDDVSLANAIGETSGDEIPLYAPITGRILRIVQESETILPAGAPVMEIGNIENDLEVVVDLISSDAVQVTVGDPVLLEDWGGPVALEGRVARIDPFGVTKYSALGVEEQRVGVVVDMLSPPEARPSLGHGYRLEARIIIWQADDVLKVPSSALFRESDGWALFRVVDGIARLTPVELGHSDGIETEVTSGLSEGDPVILYPSAGLADGAQVAPRGNI
ncbi:HlyD family efflux transporter periplasmic adaptor subunit [Loktanella sp. IMCC34160]|uniref:efflux RND transporter periplasmic adaptor subunit n=1 Tax=Loktanella sp. IMCC34160 TaxID=2510646 RepID=UPI00101D4310|nr:HlyD family efflux transporter periplasmic adaptor subunit [Loktanella sp. IMCC34160]RYG91539.1 HlyD family efflux transporter periplasmic adaptor subunit [Loktanella sp. IMCC34160]